MEWCVFMSPLEPFLKDKARRKSSFYPVPAPVPTAGTPPKRKHRFQSRHDSGDHSKWAFRLHAWQYAGAPAIAGTPLNPSKPVVPCWHSTISSRESFAPAPIFHPSNRKGHSCRFTRKNPSVVNSFSREQSRRFSENDAATKIYRPREPINRPKSGILTGGENPTKHR